MCLSGNGAWFVCFCSYRHFYVVIYVVLHQAIKEKMTASNLKFDIEMVVGRGGGGDVGGDFEIETVLGRGGGGWRGWGFWTMCITAQILAILLQLEYRYKKFQWSSLWFLNLQFTYIESLFCIPLWKTDEGVAWFWSVRNNRFVGFRTLTTEHIFCGVHIHNAFDTTRLFSISAWFTAIWPGSSVPATINKQTNK